MLTCTIIFENGKNAGSLPGRMGILIPAYNEGAHLRNVIAACRRTEPAVILVVDDASTDATPEILEREAADRSSGVPLLFIRNERNLGKQGSVRRGLWALTRMDLDSVALIDGDGQHDPAELPRLATLLGRFDLVIGSRSQEQMPAQRRFSNWLVNHAFQWIGGVDFADVQSGLRLYRRELAEILAKRLPERGRYALEHESLSILARYSTEQGRVIKAAAAPISCSYGQARSSIGPGDVLQLAIETVRQALKFREAAQPAEVAA